MERKHRHSFIPGVQWDAYQWFNCECGTSILREKRKRKTVKALAILALLWTATTAHALWDTTKNPDLVPSLGWGAHAGKLPGYSADFAKFTAFDADTRIPINNYMTLNLDVTQTTLQNAPLGISTDSYQFGVKLRVYLQDLK